jgi:branched-chain amino acid transport system substrate-binding protein
MFGFGKKVLGGALALALGVGVAGAQETLKVGAINPYSGPLALYGDELARGYELAAEAVNANGGVLGKQVEIVRGNATNPQEAIAAIEQLAGEVDVFIGTYVSGVSNAASERAMTYDKLYWDTNALAAELTARGLPNFVRVGPFSGSFAERSVDAVVDLIAAKVGKQPSELTVWIEHEESIYGTSIAEAQKAGLEAEGVKVLGVGAHSFKAIDLTDSILRAKGANPDVWIQTGYIPDGTLLLRTARDQGFKPAAMLMVGTGDTFEVLDAIGAEYLEGVLIVSYPRPDITETYGPGAAGFLEAYRTKFSSDPVAPQSMTAYTGARILFEAIEAAGSTGVEAVRTAAAAMDKPFNSYPTGYGVKFDESFQNTRALPTVAQWQNGKVVTVFPTEAVAQGTGLVGLARP